MWTSSITTARNPLNSDRAGTRVLMSMASSDSGVVMRMSAGAFEKRARELGPTSPCHLNTERPIIWAYSWTRFSWLFRSARIGET